MRFFNFTFSTFLEFRAQVFKVLGKNPVPLRGFYIPQYLFTLSKLIATRFFIFPLFFFLPYWFLTFLSFSLGAFATVVYHYISLFSDPVAALNWGFFSFFDRLSARFILEVGDFLFFPYYFSYVIFIASKFYFHKLYVFLSIWGLPYFWWVLKWIRYYVVSWLLVIPIARHSYIFLFGLVKGRFEPFGTISACFLFIAFVVGLHRTFVNYFFGDDRIRNKFYFFFFKYYYLLLVLYKTLPLFIRTPLYYLFRAFQSFFLHSLLFFRQSFFWFFRLLRSFFPTPFFPRPLIFTPLFILFLPIRSLWSVFRFLDHSLDDLSRFLTAQFFLFFDLFRLRVTSFFQLFFSFFYKINFSKAPSLPTLPKFDLFSKLSVLYRTYYPIIVKNLPQAYGWFTFFLMVLRNRIRFRISLAKEALLSFFLDRVLLFFRLLPYQVAYFFIQIFTLPFEFLHFHWNHRRGFRWRALHRSQILMQYKFYYILKPLFYRELPRPQYIIEQDSPYMRYLRAMTWDDAPRIPFYVLNTKINYVYTSNSRQDWPRAQWAEWDREERIAEKKYFPNDLMFRPRTHREMWHYCRASLGMKEDKKKLKALLKADPPLRFPRCIRSDYVRIYYYYPWESFWEWEREEARKKALLLENRLRVEKERQESLKRERGGNG